MVQVVLSEQHLRHYTQLTPQATGSSYLLRKHKSSLKHVCCTCHEGEEWTAKVKFLSKYTILLQSHRKSTDYYS